MDDVPVTCCGFYVLGEDSLIEELEHPQDIALAPDPRERARRAALLLEQLLRLLPTKGRIPRTATLRDLLYAHRHELPSFEAASACLWIRNAIVHGRGGSAEPDWIYADVVFRKSIEEVLTSHPALRSSLRKKPASRLSSIHAEEIPQSHNAVEREIVSNMPFHITSDLSAAIIQQTLAGPTGEYLSPNPPDPLQYPAYTRVANILRADGRLTKELLLKETKGDEAQVILLLANTLKAIGFLESFQRSFQYHVGNRRTENRDDYIKIISRAVEECWKISTCRRCGGHGIFLGLCYAHWIPGGKTF